MDGGWVDEKQVGSLEVKLDGQIDTWMSECVDWMEGKIYFYNFSTSKKFKEALK